MFNLIKIRYLFIIWVLIVGNFQLYGYCILCLPNSFRKENLNSYIRNLAVKPLALTFNILGKYLGANYVYFSYTFVFDEIILK
jgi:hypothetical protein